jgi:hypothetical protein
VAVGMIDIVTRKCSPWSIKGLIHFARNDMHLFVCDMQKHIVSSDME